MADAISRQKYEKMKEKSERVLQLIKDGKAKRGMEYENGTMERISANHRVDRWAAGRNKPNGKKLR